MADAYFQYETAGEFDLIVPVSRLKVRQPLGRLVKLGGLQWRLDIVKEFSAIEDNGLSVSIKCNEDMKREGWFIHMKLTLKLRLVSEPGKCEIIKKDEDIRFSHVNVTKQFTVPHFKKFEQILDQQNGYMNDDHFSIVFELTIVKSGGINNRLCTFGSVREGTADIILKVDGKRIAVSSQLLALHSPFFHTLFYGNFGDRHKNEEGDEDFDYELKEVDYNDFVLLLKAIYPERRKPSKDSVAGLLKLADQWDFNEVRIRCDVFIATAKSMCDVDKMVL